MTEVAAAVLADHLAYLEAKGIPLESWLGDDPHAQATAERFRRARDRVAWTEFVPLCDRYWRLVESRGLSNDFVDYLMRAPTGFIAHLRNFVSVLISPRAAYHAIARFAGRSAFHCIEGKVTSSDRQHLRMEVRIQPGYAHCAGFFHFTALTFERIPRLLGHPNALVEATISDRRCEYVITLPPVSGTWKARIKAILSLPFGARLLIAQVADRENELRDSYQNLVRSQAELSAVRDQLEARVGERTRDLAAAKDDAESANRAKTVFLANVSHELRTPLTSILGFVDLVRARGADEVQRLRAVEVIERNGRQLLQLVDDLLDVSRAESGELPVTVATASLLSEVTGVVASLGLEAERRGIELRVSVADDVPDVMRTDPVRLRQILTNVVGNALKFTSRGHIEVRAGLAPPEADRSQRMVVVEIEDTGSGIPSSHRQAIFQPFVQADSSMTRQHGGAGLGLTIAHRLARALGGDLVLVRSVAGEGSLFRLMLPVAL